MINVLIEMFGLLRTFNFLRLAKVKLLNIFNLNVLKTIIIPYFELFR